MRAGKRNNRIDLQQKLQVPNGSGGFTETWATQVPLWASVAPTPGKETVKAGQVNASVTYLVGIMYRTDVTPKNRIKWGSKILNIRSVTDPAGAHERLEILCEEEAANG